MVQAKITLFEEELQKAAELFKVLSHPARLAILRHLAKTRTCISGDITQELPLSRTTVKQHMDELKKVGLIKGTTEGVKINYCLNTEMVEQVKQMSQKLFDELNVTITCDCELADL